MEEKERKEERAERRKEAKAEGGPTLESSSSWLRPAPRPLLMAENNDYK